MATIPSQKFLPVRFVGTRRAGREEDQQAEAHSRRPAGAVDTGHVVNWNALNGLLRQSGPAVRLTWSELERLVGTLPPSASNHRAWWSGDRSHVRAWRLAGFTATSIALGQEVTFVRSSPVASRAPEDRGLDPDLLTSKQASRSRSSETADLLLVTCVKTKLTIPAAAKDLYISTLFKKERAYAEQVGVPWFILSAEHGLVAPDEWLAPYERYLPATSASYRSAWGARSTERLEILFGPVDGTTIEIHASSVYVKAIAQPLTAKGAAVIDPLHGLSRGARLDWYVSRLKTPTATSSTRGLGQMPSDVWTFVNTLLDEARAITPAVLLSRQGAGLKVPGMYSWWVDEVGASQLSEGLELPVSAGLIYAGLAGATRWPSGKQSENTLWSRISGMHLGGRHELSTLRTTLGSILARGNDSPVIDEGALTEWMMKRLKVIAAPCADADSLGRLEDGVLMTIDPPFNLKGMAGTPLRLRIKELRRLHR
jgi:hypothetical protein